MTILNEEDSNLLWAHATNLHSRGNFIGDLDVFGIYDILEKAFIEKTERDNFTDSKISYDDEIVSIELIGDLDTIDISVTGDNLFICNDILTKNSMGLVMTLDVFFALIRTDELDEQNSIMIKQLKNRYADPGQDKRFIVGLNKPKMTFYDLEDSAQGAILPEATNKTYAPRKPNEEKQPKATGTPVWEVKGKKALNDAGFTF